MLNHNVVKPMNNLAPSQSGFTPFATNDVVTLVRVNTCIEKFCCYRGKWAVRSKGDQAFALGTTDLAYVEQEFMCKLCSCCPIPCCMCCSRKYHVYTDSTKQKELFRYDLGGCCGCFSCCWNLKYRIFKTVGEESQIGTLLQKCKLCPCLDGLYYTTKTGEAERYDIGTKCNCCYPENVARMWIFDKEKDNARVGKVMKVRKYCLMCCPKKAHWDIQFPENATEDEKVLITGSAFFADNEPVLVGFESEA